MTVAPVQAKVEERLEQLGVRIRSRRAGQALHSRCFATSRSTSATARSSRSSARLRETTLLRCIDGLIPADGGEVRSSSASPTVFQHFGLFPWKTVYDNVAYGLRMAGVPRAEIEHRVPYFIAMVGLATSRRPIRTRCRRMRARCGLARARSSRTCC